MQQGSSPSMAFGGNLKIKLKDVSVKHVERRSFQSTPKWGQIFFSLPNPDSNNIIIML